MALIRNKHAKIMASWVLIGIGGFSSFLLVKKISTANKKKEAEIRRQIKKRVEQEMLESREFNDFKRIKRD